MATTRAKDLGSFASGQTVSNLSVGIITATSANFINNITTNLIGNVTGDVTGDVTGNVNSTGISTFTTLKVGYGVTISAGIVTANSFSGLGIGLTSISSFSVKNELVSVKDYGVVGDGSTDDTSNIQNALDSGNSLFFPKGTYLITGELTLSGKTNVRLIGYGATIQRNDATNEGEYLLKVLNCTDAQIVGLTFKTNGTLVDNYPSDVRGITTGTNGVRIGDCYSTIVTDCYFTRVNSGLEIRQNNLNCIASNNTFYEVGRKGIGVYESTDTTITGNIISKVSGSLGNKKYSDGIYIYANNGVICSGNRINDVRRIGIVFEENGGIDPSLRPRNTNIVVDGNTIENAHDALSTENNACIWVEPNCGDETCTISNNHCYISNTFGIYGNSGVLVRGNYVDSCLYGIDATNGPLRFINNTVINSDQAGMRCRVTQDSHFIGNVVRNCGTGIRCTGNILKSLTIAHNHIENNNDAGIDYDFTANGSGINVTAMITSNTFVSDASEGATSGNQPYGIRMRTDTGGISESDYGRAVLVQNNQFLFRGSFTSSYPSILTVSPSDLSLGSGNTLSYFGGNNVSSKIPYSEWMTLTSPNGTKYRLIVDNSGNLSTESI